MKTIFTFFVFLIVSLMTTTLEAQSITITTNPSGVFDDGYLNVEEYNNAMITFTIRLNNVILIDSGLNISVRSSLGSQRDRTITNPSSISGDLVFELSLRSLLSSVLNDQVEEKVEYTISAMIASRRNQTTFTYDKIAPSSPSRPVLGEEYQDSRLPLTGSVYNSSFSTFILMGTNAAVNDSVEIISSRGDERVGGDRADSLGNWSVQVILNTVHQLAIDFSLTQRLHAVVIDSAGNRSDRSETIEYKHSTKPSIQTATLIDGNEDGEIDMLVIDFNVNVFADLDIDIGGSDGNNLFDLLSFDGTTIQFLAYSNYSDIVGNSNSKKRHSFVIDLLTNTGTSIPSDVTTVKAVRVEDRLFTSSKRLGSISADTARVLLTDGVPPRIIRAQTTLNNDSLIVVEIQLSESVQDDLVRNHLNEFALTHPIGTGYCQTGTFTGFSTSVSSIDSVNTADDQYFSLVYTPCDSFSTGVYRLRYNGTSIVDVGNNNLALPSEGFRLEDKIPPRILYAETFDTDEDQVVDKVEIILSEPIKDSVNGTLIDASNFSLQETFYGITITNTFNNFSTAIEEIQSTNTINDQYFSLTFTSLQNDFNSTGVFTLIYGGRIQDIQDNTVNFPTGSLYPVTDGIPPHIRKALTLDTDGDGRIDKVEIELTENINDTNISADSFSLTPPMGLGNTDTLSVFNTAVTVITSLNDTDDDDQYFSLSFNPTNSRGTGIDTLRYFGSSLTDAAGNTLLLPDGYFLPEDSAMLTIFNSTTIDEDGDGNVDKVEIEASEFINDQIIGAEVNDSLFTLAPPMGFGRADILSNFSTITTEITNDTDANDQYFSLTFTPTHAMGTGIDTLRYTGTTFVLSETDRVLTDGAPPIILRSVTLDTNRDGSVETLEIALSENINDANISFNDFTLTPSLGFGRADILSNFSTITTEITNDTDANDQYFSLTFNPTNSRGTGIYTLRYSGTLLVDGTGNALLPFVGVSEDKALPLIVDKNSDLIPGDNANDIGVINELRMMFSERVRWDANKIITFVKNAIPPISIIYNNANRIGSITPRQGTYDALVTITIPETTTGKVTNYYTVIQDGAFIDESDNRSLDQNFTENTTWNFTTRRGLDIRSIDVNSNKDIVLNFNDSVTLSTTVDSSGFTLRNSLDTFRITGVFHDNSQPTQVRIVINEADTASVFGDLFLSFDGFGSDGIGGTTKINSANFGILEDFDSLHIDFDNDNPTLRLVSFNEDTIHLTFSERVQISDTRGVNNFTITDGKGIRHTGIIDSIIDGNQNDSLLSLKLNISLNSFSGDITLHYGNVTTGIEDFGDNQLVNFNRDLNIDIISPTIKNIFMVSGGVGIEDTLVLVFSEDINLLSNDFNVFSLSDEKGIPYDTPSLIDDVSSTNDTILLTTVDLSNVTTNLTLTYSGAIIADYGGNNLKSASFSNRPILSVFKDTTPLFYCRDLSSFFLNINDIPLGIDTKDTTSVDPPEDDIEKDDFYKIEIYYKQNNVINTEIGNRGIFNTAGGEISVITSNDTLLSYTGNSMAGTPSRAGESWRLNLAALNNLSIRNRTLIDTLLLIYVVSKDDGSASKALASKEIYILPERPSLTTDISGRGSLIESSGDYELKFCDGEEVPEFVADTSVTWTWLDDNERRQAFTNNTSVNLSDIFPRAVNSVVNYDADKEIPYDYEFSFSKLSVLVEDSIRGGCPSRKVNISVNPKPSFPAFDSLIGAREPEYLNFLHVDVLREIDILYISLCETDISRDNDSLQLRVTPNSLTVDSFKIYSGEIEERVLIYTQEATRNSMQEEFFLFDYSVSSSDGERSIDTVFYITQINGVDSTEQFTVCKSDPLTVNIVIHPQPDLPITEGSDSTENEYIFCNVDVLKSSIISIKSPDTSHQYTWYRDEGLTDILLSNNSSIGMDMLIRANIVDTLDFTTDSIYVVARSKGCDSERQLVTIKNNPNDLGIEFADDKTGAINSTEFCLSSDSAIIKGVLEGNKVDGEFSIDTFGMVSRSNPILTHTLGTTLDTLAMFNSEDSTLTINFLGLHSAKQNSLSMVGGSTSVIPIRFTYSDADRCANTYTSIITIHPLPEIDFIATKSIDRSEINFNFTSDSLLLKGEVCYDAFSDLDFSGNLIDAAGDILPINTGLKFYLNDVLEEEATSLRGTYTFSISDNVSSANISEEDTIRLEYIHPISNSMASDDGCMNTMTKILQVNALPSIEFSFDFDSNDSTDNSFCFTKISGPDINEDTIKVRKDTLHITVTSSTISTTGDTISVPPDSSSWSLSGSSMDLTQGFMDKQNGIVDLFPEILHTAALSNRLEGGSSSEISANFTITDKKSCMGTNSAPVRIHPLPEISFGILRGTDASTIIQSNNELDNLSATICYTEKSLIFRGVELAYNDITDETDTLDAIITDIGFTVNNQPVSLQNGRFLFRMSDEYIEEEDTLKYVEDLHSRDTLNILFTYTHPSTGCINTIKKTLYIDPLPDVTDILPIEVCKGDDATVKIEVENLHRVDSIQWSYEFPNASGDTITMRLGNDTISSSYDIDTKLPNTNNPDNLIVTAVVYESECSSSFSKTILIGEFPDPKVSWLGITKGLSTDFKLIENNSNLANNNIDSIYYSVFKENNNRTLLREGSVEKMILEGRNPIDNILHTFSHPFSLENKISIDVYMRSDKGCDSTIRRNFTILPHKEIGVEGYFENFENGKRGWLVELRGNDNPINNNDVVSWELGDAIRLDDDGEVNNYGNSSQFWITGVNKHYEEGEISYVYSPSFDFTESFEKLTVSFDIYFRFESVKDGVVFQYSTNNGLDWRTLGTDETGLNWYNARSIDSGPGNTRIGGSSNDNFNSETFGWADKMLDDSKWLNASAAIPIPLEDRGSVRFRFALAAQRGSKSDSTIGFAFDNFRIFGRDKVVLIEQFMSVNNADAKNNHDILDSLYKNDNAFNTTDIIWINYFIDFTNENEDIFFLRNREDPSARASNYAINEIPEIIITGKTRENAHLLIDGSFDETFLNDAENELLGTSGFSIDGPFVEFNEDTLTVSSSITRLPPSITNDASELGVYFIVIEPEVILTETMGEYEVGDTIKNVVRKILPNAVGDYERGEWIEDDVRAFPVKWRVSNLSTGNNKLQVVVFIQNFDETRNVHQAKISEVITLPTIGGPTGIDNHFSDVTILYPNPISDHHFILEFSRPTLTDLLWRMYDQTGKSIKNGWIPNSVSHHQISINDLSDGMYFIMIKYEAKQKTTIKRFLVRKEK